LTLCVRPPTTLWQTCMLVLVANWMYLRSKVAMGWDILQALDGEVLFERTPKAAPGRMAHVDRSRLNHES